MRAFRNRFGNRAGPEGADSEGSAATRRLKGDGSERVINPGGTPHRSALRNGLNLDALAPARMSPATRGALASAFRRIQDPEAYDQLLTFVTLGGLENDRQTYFDKMLPTARLAAAVAIIGTTYDENVRYAVSEEMPPSPIVGAAYEPPRSLLTVLGVPKDVSEGLAIVPAVGGQFPLSSFNLPSVEPGVGVTVQVGPDSRGSMYLPEAIIVVHRLPTKQQ